MAIVYYDNKNKVLDKLFQWDVNQTISVEGVPVSSVPIFHFCNTKSKSTFVVTGTISNGRVEADIPNILLQQGETLIVYLCAETSNNGVRTICSVRIPVVPRAKPEDYELKENEVAE